MKGFTLNIRGRLVDFDRPAVMGIVNATPDSFYPASRAADAAAIAARTRQLLANGADIIDVGACSTRPGAEQVSATEECERLRMALNAVRAVTGPEVPVSVDTYRAEVARLCIEHLGADIVNDISGCSFDPAMAETVADLACPYVLMHTRGTPQTMQSFTDYADVTADVIRELSQTLWRLDELGVADVIVDPGFGFAKTVQQNYQLMQHLDAFAILGRPILVGVSRKSMITKLLGVSSDDALVPTAILGAYALDRGAAILRVHDTLAARQAVNMYCALTNNDLCLTSE